MNPDFDRLAAWADEIAREIVVGGCWLLRLINRTGWMERKSTLVAACNYPKQRHRHPSAALVEAAGKTGLIIKELVGKSHPHRWQSARRGAFPVLKLL